MRGLQERMPCRDRKKGNVTIRACPRSRVLGRFRGLEFCRRLQKRVKPMRARFKSRCSMCRCIEWSVSRSKSSR